MNCWPGKRPVTGTYRGHYTLMPLHMRSFFEPIELRNATLFGPFDFTKGVQVLRLPVVAEAKANMASR